MPRAKGRPLEKIASLCAISLLLDGVVETFAINKDGQDPINPEEALEYDALFKVYDYDESMSIDMDELSDLLQAKDLTNDIDAKTERKLFEHLGER